MNRAPRGPDQPDYRTAIVHTQIVLVLLAVGSQLFLLTVTVERFLAGDASGVISLTIASALALLLSYIIWRAYR